MGEIFSQQEHAEDVRRRTLDTAAAHQEWVGRCGNAGGEGSEEGNDGEAHVVCTCVKYEGKFDGRL
jgi:hypothetical protein